MPVHVEEKSFFPCTEEVTVRARHLVAFAAALVAAAALNSGSAIGQQAPANPAHVHLGHVMTSWKDTPEMKGLLPAAIADARVAATHAGLAAKAPDNLDAMKLHAGHVLNALDPSIEPKGPGSGYGVKKAAAGALAHVGFAAKTDGASKNVLTHAAHVSAALGDVVQWTDQAMRRPRRSRRRHRRPKPRRSSASWRR